MTKPSIVAKEFGPSGHDAQGFVRSHIPKKWKPEIVMSGMLERVISNGLCQGYHTRIIRLKNFPVKTLSLNADPRNPKAWELIKKQFKEIRDDALRWLYTLEDKRAISLRNGMSVGLGVGHFTSDYTAGRYCGSFTATFIGHGTKEATLIAQLREGAIEKKPPNIGLNGRQRVRNPNSRRRSATR